MSNVYRSPPKFSGDASPQLSGSLDVNQQKIVSTSNQDITLEPHGTGVVRVENSNVDVDGELVADKLSWGSALGLWGVPHFEVVEFNDAFWKADVRYIPNSTHSLSLESSWVSTPLDADGNPHGSYPPTTRSLHDLRAIFDGDFDTYAELGGSDPNPGDAEYTGGFNTKHVIIIDNTGTTFSGAGHAGGFVYPQGAVYLTFYHISKYYDGTPSLEYQVRYSADWVQIAAPTEVARASIDPRYSTLKWEIPAVNYQTKLRLTMLAKPRTVARADRVGNSWWAYRIGIASLNYYMDRFFTNDVEPPYASKYSKRNTMLSQILIEDGSADDPTLGFRSTLNNYTTIGNFHKGKVQAGICYDSSNAAMVLTGGGAAALAINSDQKVGVNTVTPETELHLNGSLTLQAQASAPSDPIAGQSVLWMNANGDIQMKINVGGTIKTATLADFSSL